VKQIRKELNMSSAEPAGKVGVSPMTIGKIEKGCNCRIETKKDYSGTWKQPFWKRYHLFKRLYGNM